MITSSVRSAKMLLVALVALNACTRVYAVPMEVLSDDLLRDDPERSASAMRAIKTSISNDPRNAVAECYRLRVCDSLLKAERYEQVIELAHLAVVAQPYRLDRVQYFLTCQINALLASKKPNKALQVAKSLFNVAELRESPKVLKLVANCLDASVPDRPGAGRRFLYDQLQLASGATSGLDNADSLRPVQIDAEIYQDEILTHERSREYREIGRANLFLMSDKLDQAVEIFERLKSSRNRQTADVARAGLARCVKAQTMSLTAANETLTSNLAK